MTLLNDRAEEHIDNVYDRVHVDADLYGSDFGHLVIGIVVLELEAHPKLQLFEVVDFAQHITVKLLLLLIFVNLAWGLGCVLGRVREEHHEDCYAVLQEFHGKNATHQSCGMTLEVSLGGIGPFQGVMENIFFKINDIKVQRWRPV